GLLNLVEQQDRKLELVSLPLVERFLREKRVRLAVTQIARRRADQLCDLVRVLEFRAVNLDTGARITEQRLRHRLDYTGLARAGRTEKEQIAYRATGRVQSRQEHLVHLYHSFNRLLL